LVGLVLMAAAIVSGAVISEPASSTAQPVATKIVVHSVDTNLSRFMPQMLAQARMAEQRQTAQASAPVLPAATPTDSESE
ncbi:hypothetical protein LPJ70_005934, partial [Coemansia sp. RSA 2708]